MKALLACAAACAGALALATPAAATGLHGFNYGDHGSNSDILFLNSYETPSDGAAGPVTTDMKLKAGKKYDVIVGGTVSTFREELWIDPPAPFVVCGETEPRPQIPSPGRPRGPVGMDAETIFALPFPFGPGSCGSLPMPQHWTNFEMNDGTGFKHVEPVGGPQTQPSKYHLYKYEVTGTGQKLSFRLRDAETRDNYGVFGIYVDKK